MKILFIETSSEGHYVYLYLNLILEKFIKKKVEINLMATKEVVKNLKSNVRREIQNIYYIKKTPEPKRYDFISLLIYQVKYYFNIKKNFQKLQDKKIPNYIYINTLDHFDKALAIFGSPFSNISFSGLLCKCKFHLHSLKIGPFNFLNFLYKFMFIKIYNITTLKKIFLIDPLIIDYFNKTQKNCKKLFHVNDALKKNSNVISKKSINLFKKKFFINKNNFIILVYGAMRKDKAINELFNAIQGAKFQKKITVIIAGLQDDYTSKYIKNFKNNNNLTFDLISLNKFIDYKLEKIIFSISNLVWAAYINYYGSSGVYFLSGYMKIPLIISKKGLICWLNKQYNIAISADIKNIQDVQNKISFMIKNGNNFYRNNLNRFHNKYLKNSFEDKIVKEVLKLV
jgi:hypothetical protein